MFFEYYNLGDGETHPLVLPLTGLDFLDSMESPSLMTRPFLMEKDLSL